jgi:trk system potassium uptake protein TrkA
MNIVIVGDGNVGYTLAEELSNEGHDVTIIDKNTATLSRSIEALDVIGVQGNGASYDVQMEAGVEKADILIAATSADEVNILCCLLAKKIGAKNTIARVRNHEYNKQLVFLKEELGLSMVINPEKETAKEISRVINFPSAISVSSLAEGRISLIEFRMTADHPIVGRPLHTVNNYDTDILICAVDRSGKAIIPNGDFIIEEHDKIHILGKFRDISAFLRLHPNHADHQKARSVMIVGGGRMSYYLAMILIESGIKIKIIEKNPEVCERLCELLPKAIVICGDGLEQELLDAEGISETGALVALTNMDEENLLISMYAKSLNVPKVITKINRLNYMNVIHNAGLDSVISPKLTVANQIVQYVRAMENTRGSKVNTMFKLIDEQVEVLEFTATKTTKNLNTELKKMKVKPNIMISALIKNGKLVIPHGDNKISAGDTVVVASSGYQINDLNEIFL